MADIDTNQPAPPAFLNAKAAKQWSKTYADTLVQATVAIPDNPRAQRIAALKAANAMFTISPLKTTKDADALESWQKLKDVTITIDGVNTRVVVTCDGRKYAFPIA